MPANTSKGYPYPVGTDRVADGDDSIKALAEAVNVKLGVCASSFFTAAAPGTSGGVVSTAVTFPVGLFTAVPQCVANPNVTDPSTAFACTFSPTTAGVSIRTQRPGAPSTCPVTWIAIQPG